MSLWLFSAESEPFTYSLDDAIRTHICEIALYEDIRARPAPGADELARRKHETFEAVNRVLGTEPGDVLRLEHSGDEVRDLLGAASLLHLLRNAPELSSRPAPHTFEIHAADQDGSGQSVAAARILPVFRGMLARLEQLARAGSEGADSKNIPEVFACGTCDACARLEGAEVQLPAPEQVEADEPDTAEPDSAADAIEGGYPVPAPVESEDERHLIQQQLDERLQALERAKDAAHFTEDERTLAFALAATNYHRRERAPFWREHMRRLYEPVASWAGSRDCAVFESVQVISDWQKATVGSGQVRVLRAVALVGEGSALKVGRDKALYVMYEAAHAPARAVDAMESQVNTFRHANPGAYVPRTVARVGFFGAHLLEAAPAEEPVSADGLARVVLVVEERIRVKDEPHEALPVALAPAATVPTVALEQSLQDFARSVDASLPDVLPASEAVGVEGSPGEAIEPAAGGVSAAALDILYRRPPRLVTGGSLPTEADFSGEDLPMVRAVHAAVCALDSSYVAVQGPPGSGKTFLGSHVIASLVAAGWRVGVVAQSHAVVENMLAAVVERGLFPAERVAKLAGTSQRPDFPWAEWSRATIQQRCAGGANGEGFVFGGTAWNFSNASLFEQASLDLLVVDEAGQFSLANTLAVARSARNLLLLGDPQQLPQVSSAPHPYPVDISTLSWLSGDAPTVDERFGYFLPVSWRMHPQLCAPVSRLSYGGRLASAPAAALRHLEGRDPGLQVVPVSHRRCTVRSEVEAAEVVRLAQEFVGARWDAGDGAVRALTGDDIVVVAAYNAQVDTIVQHLERAGLRDAQGHGVRVGTVDKFQGQQAPVTVVSLAASNAGASGRGAEFLLSPNRLNVAISRGQWCSVLVCSSTIHRFVPATAQQLAVLGDFMVLCNLSDY
mgnify:FL=1